MEPMIRVLQGTAVQRTLRVLSGIVTTVAAVLLALLIVLSAGDAIMRNVSGSGLPGAIQIAELFLVVITMLGLLIAQRHRDHVAIDVIAMRLPRRAAEALEGFGYLVVSAILLLAAWTGLQSALGALERGEVLIGIVGIPTWPARLAVPVGFLALALQMTVQGLLSLAGRPDHKIDAHDIAQAE